MSIAQEIESRNKKMKDKLTGKDEKPQERETWMTELPDFNKITFPENPPMPFEEILPDASPEAIDLVRQFLVYPSKQRISAKKALLHPYFFTEPLPAHHSDLPIPQRNRTERQRAERGGRGFYVEAMDAVIVNPELIAPHVPYAPTSTSATKEASRRALDENSGAGAADAEHSKKSS